MPRVVEQDLLDDPEQLSIQCIRFLRYSEAKSAFDNAEDEKALEHWKGSPVMEAVQRNWAALFREQKAKREAEEI